MKLKNFTKKKAVAFGLAFGVAAGAGGIAAAYFSAQGSGTGAAKAGTTSALKITQVGASYDSLIASNSGNPYSASLCYSCAGFTQIGDAGTLAYLTTATYAQVTSVTVPLVNFGAAKTLNVTLNLYHSPNVPSYSFTKTFNIAGGSATNQVVSTVTFTLAKTAVFLYRNFQYGIHLTTQTVSGVRNTSGVNIGLVNHTSALAIGSSPAKTVWLAKGSAAFAATTTTWNTGYIPAVQVNVIGGVVPPLYPGGPAQPVKYAITNPNPGSLHVTSITTSIKQSGTVITSVNSGCKAKWFTLTPTGTYSYTKTVPTGTTIVTTSPTKLKLVTMTGTQDACASASIPLHFSSH